MKATKIESKDMSHKELAGTIEYSIYTSILGLSELGINKEDLFNLKNEIDALSASLWSVFVMQRRISVDDNVEEAEEHLALLDEQIQRQLHRLKELSISLSKKEETLQ